METANKDSSLLLEGTALEVKSDNKAIVEVDKNKRTAENTIEPEKNDESVSVAETDGTSLDQSELSEKNATKLAEIETNLDHTIMSDRNEEVLPQKGDTDVTDGKINYEDKTEGGKIDLEVEEVKKLDLDGSVAKKGNSIVIVDDGKKDRAGRDRKSRSTKQKDASNAPKHGNAKGTLEKEKRTTKEERGQRQSDDEKENYPQGDTAHKQTASTIPFLPGAMYREGALEQVQNKQMTEYLSVAQLMDSLCTILPETQIRILQIPMLDTAAAPAAERFD